MNTQWQKDICCAFLKRQGTLTDTSQLTIFGAQKRGAGWRPAGALLTWHQVSGQGLGPGRAFCSERTAVSHRVTEEIRRFLPHLLHFSQENDSAQSSVPHSPRPPGQAATVSPGVSHSLVLIVTLEGWGRRKVSWHFCFVFLYP
jgi:hypothetical protein